MASRANVTQSKVKMVRQSYFYVGGVMIRKIKEFFWPENKRVLEIEMLKGGGDTLRIPAISFLQKHGISLIEAKLKLEQVLDGDSVRFGLIVSEETKLEDIAASLRQFGFSIRSATGRFSKPSKDDFVLRSERRRKRKLKEKQDRSDDDPYTYGIDLLDYVD